MPQVRLARSWLLQRGRAAADSASSMLTPGGRATSGEESGEEGGTRGRAASCTEPDAPAALRGACVLLSGERVLPRAVAALSVGTTETMGGANGKAASRPGGSISHAPASPACHPSLAREYVVCARSLVLNADMRRQKADQKQPSQVAPGRTPSEDSAHTALDRSCGLIMATPALPLPLCLLSPDEEEETAAEGDGDDGGAAVSAMCRMEASSRSCSRSGAGTCRSLAKEYIRLDTSAGRNPVPVPVPAEGSAFDSAGRKLTLVPVPAASACTSACRRRRTMPSRISAAGWFRLSIPGLARPHRQLASACPLTPPPTPPRSSRACMCCTTAEASSGPMVMRRRARDQTTLEVAWSLIRGRRELKAERNASTQG